MQSLEGQVLDSFQNMESLLPNAVKRRVHALKGLQVQCANIEAKF